MTSALPLLPSIRELAKEGRIHAVKCTRNGDAITALRAECGEDILICDPYESHALANLLRSGQHTLSADPEPYLYQLPEMRPIHDYFEEHRRANFVAMLDQRAQLEPLRRVYEFWIQTPLMRGQPINAALKHWCRRMGLAAGPARRPLRELTASQAAALDADLDTAFQSALGAKLEALARGAPASR